MVVVSRSGTEYHRAEPLDDSEALRWRELEWRCLPDATRKGTVPYLTTREVGRLDCAMTKREARPHLVKSYKGMQSPAFNGYVYKDRGKDYQKELQWARKRGIDLKGFTLKVEGTVLSGKVLVRLIGGYDRKYLNLDLATYYVTRGKLTHLDERALMKIQLSLWRVKRATWRWSSVCWLLVSTRKRPVSGAILPWCRLQVRGTSRESKSCSPRGQEDTVDK